MTWLHEMCILLLHIIAFCVQTGMPLVRHRSGSIFPYSSVETQICTCPEILVSKNVFLRTRSVLSSSKTPMPMSVHSGAAEPPTVQNKGVPWSEVVMTKREVQFCVGEKHKEAEDVSVVVVLKDKNAKRIKIGGMAEDGSIDATQWCKLEMMPVMMAQERNESNEEGQGDESILAMSLMFNINRTYTIEHERMNILLR